MSAAQAHVRQFKARAELKSREAKDSFALAQAAEEKAQTLEAAGLAQAGPFSPLPYSTSPYSPLALQSPALLRGLAGGSGALAKGWMPSVVQSRAHDPGAVPGSSHTGVALQRPSTPSKPVEADEEQAQLMQATWSALSLSASLGCTSQYMGTSMHIRPPIIIRSCFSRILSQMPCLDVDAQQSKLP